MDLIPRFQDLVAQVPEFVQPLIVALAGAVPFIEGEGAAVIGVIGGVHPVAAVLAGIAGNFLCVLVLVTLSSRTRSAIVSPLTMIASDGCIENGRGHPSTSGAFAKVLG
jgi:hypothetical protein